MRKFNTISFVCILCLAVSGFSQIVTSILPGDNIAPDDPNIPIKNDVYDPDGSSWTWRYYPESTSEPQHRDLGQSFTVNEAFTLDKIYIEIENELINTQAQFDAIENAAFHMDFYKFNAVGDFWPSDTLWSQSGTLPADFDSSYIKGTYDDPNVLFITLVFDIEDYALEAGTVYGFLLKFDELKSNQTLNFNKTHADDYYVEGALYFVPFGGTRENMLMETPQHPGENPRRDLNFWVVKGEDDPSPVEEDVRSSSDFLLAQNYPNPFNPTTTIDYAIPQSGNVRLSVYDIMGKKIKTLVNHVESAGTHTIAWDATDNAGHSVPSGTYIYKLEYSDHVLHQKLLLLK